MLHLSAVTACRPQSGDSGALRRVELPLHILTGPGCVVEESLLAEIKHAAHE